MRGSFGGTVALLRIPFLLAHQLGTFSPKAWFKVARCGMHGDCEHIETLYAASEADGTEERATQARYCRADACLEV